MLYDNASGIFPTQEMATDMSRFDRTPRDPALVEQELAKARAENPELVDLAEYIVLNNPTFRAARYEQAKRDIREILGLDNSCSSVKQQGVKVAPEPQ
jgi:hypothetical protein